ncbi:MAG TPA: YhjD/YihY/BrkB family envelope integrity protein [Candidatus Binataceae bacterium]|nr:YhjD/YihY/BrkB family envelope integrity protein [Candidatus Binataceae bacterium]
MSDSPHDLLGELYARAQARDSRLARALRSRTAGVIERVIEGFQRNNDLLWASALTYTTGLSIVPILAVALSALKGLGGAEVIRPLIERFVGAHSPEITDRLLSFVARANARTLGAVGAATLLVTVVLTLGTIEQAFNQIFRVVSGRSLGRRFADYLSVTFAVPVLLAGALGVRQFLVNRLPEVPGAGWISSTIAIWAGFLFLYVFFPNRRVRLEAAALGSLAASILLQIAQWGFIYFQLGISRYAAIYGALAAVPVLLTWIYMTWVVVLLGGEMTAAFERRNQPLAMEPWMQSERAAALMAVLRLGERMAGRPGAVTRASLAAEFAIDEPTMTEVVRRLQRGGLVIETSGDGAGGGLFLARDSGTIGLGEVIDCMRADEHAQAIAVDGRVAAIVERVHAAEREALGALTVKDMVERAASSPTTVPPSPAEQNAPSSGSTAG